MIRRALLALCPPLMLGAGVAWWIHPGAGLAASALLVCIDNLLPDPASGGRRKGGA